MAGADVSKGINALDNPRPIWTPTVPQDQIPMNIYRAHINRKFNQKLRSSQELHQWSVNNLQNFWTDLHQYTGIIPALPPTVTTAYDPNTPMEQVPEFFRGATVNYAENVLSGRDHDKKALVGVREEQELSGEVWTWGLLRENVRKARSALLQLGVREGDRVSAIISTSVWSVGLFLATSSIGAIWTSIAPDLGEEVRVEHFNDGREILMEHRDVSRDCNKSHRGFCLLIASRHTKASSSRTCPRFAISSRGWKPSPRSF
jgi:hypothetical protein